MPRRNQIPCLCEQLLADGSRVWHWKPSPRLRRAGWKNLKLGNDRKAALRAALERNDEVEAWERGSAGLAAPVAPPRRRRWRDLVAAYLAADAFTGLRPKSQAEYASRLRTLTRWALDGELVLRELDKAMVMDLRNALVGDGRKHRTAALLRVLRVALQFAVNNGWIDGNPASDIEIPEAPSRKRVLSPADVEALAAAARAMAEPRLALAITLGFWTFQRESDLLSLTRLNWREMKDMPADARAILAGPDGRVMGFRLQQQKTGAWVDIALAHWLRAEVEATGFADGALLPYADWKLQRLFRAVAKAAGVEGAQFRDFRRSGMVYFGELSVPLPFITAMSGHAVLGERRTILDTYMPGNSRFAAQGMAIATARHLERQVAERVEQGGQG